MERRIKHWITELRVQGAHEVDQYEARLRSQADNLLKTEELLSEARVALMFLRNGWKVTMRDAPDLSMEHGGKMLFAEVKHFHMKKTDTCDDFAMATTKDTDLLLPAKRVSEFEGAEPWEQICSVAIKKVPQYSIGFPNILIFVSQRDSLDVMLQSAINEFDDTAAKPGADPALRALNGMMMLSNNYSPIDGWHNVEFLQTANPVLPLSPSLASALAALRWG